MGAWPNRKRGHGVSFGKDNKEKEFNSAVGHKASIDRWESQGEDAFNANFELQKIGQIIKGGHDELREHDYLGSMAVHVYMTPTLETPVFACQAPLGKCPEVLASAALVDLKGSAMEFFGRARQKKRSGF